nr:replication initiation protein [Moraxella osloensis]
MDENGNLGVFIPSNLITMNNDMIRACYNVVTNEMRLLLVAMAKTPKIITPKDNYKGVDGFCIDDYKLDPFTPYYISKEDFIKLGVEPKNAVREIKSACDDLMNKQVTLKSEAGEHIFNWVSSVFFVKTDNFERLKNRYLEDPDYIKELKKQGRDDVIQTFEYVINSEENVIARIVFTPDALKYIALLQKEFTKFHLEDLGKFTSFYSFRIYMLLMIWQDTGMYFVTLNDFRKILQITDKYVEICDLRKRVLNVAMKEINEHSSFKVDYKLTDKSGKSGRGIKVSNIRFNFRLKKENQLLTNDGKKSPSWQKKGLSNAQIRKLHINIKEFVDANTGKISPNDRRDYGEIFDSWIPQLKDPATVLSFNKIQELLDRKKSV